MFGIDDVVYYGRHIEEYRIFIDNLVEYLDADILVFSHNYSFEFQFLRNIFSENVEVFARKKRKPLKTVDGCVEHRCTYMLTRLSLANWAKNKRLPVRKKEGDLDYNVLRTPYTKLSKTELGYCENDILVMYHGIKQYLNDYNTVWDIPLTQTGIVRKAYNDMLKDDDRLHRRMAKLVPDYELYTLLLKAFWGGIAHASFKWCNELLVGVDSYDKKSSYPWELVSRKYPMTPFIKCKYNDRYLRNEMYSYLITVELFEFTSTLKHSYLSSSKCLKNSLQGEVLDNGRLIHADHAIVTCTNVDYEIILDSYDIKDINVLDFRISLNEYLNKEIRLFILDWFYKKTTLDGLEEYEELYKKSKEFINAIYGMMVTREFTDEIVYENEEWLFDKLTKDKFDEKVVKKLRKKRKLNNAFQIGVWCTAYARKSLWDSVTAEIDGEKVIDDVSVYLDTDSNKFFACEKSRRWIKEYNDMILRKQDMIAKDLGISPDRLRPKRPDGKVCAMGVYEYEGTYKEFKTLGAKKYCYKQTNVKTGEDEIHITVSGVRKAAASQLKSVDDFKNDLVFDIEHAKKNILSYQDDQDWCVINKGQYDEFACMYKYGVCCMPTTYSMSMSQDYVNLVYDFVTLYSELFDYNEVLERIVSNAKKYQKK